MLGGEKLGKSCMSEIFGIQLDARRMASRKGYLRIGLGKKRRWRDDACERLIIQRTWDPCKKLGTSG